MDTESTTKEALLRSFVSKSRIKKMSEERLRIYVHRLANRLELEYWDTMTVLCDMADRECPLTIFAKSFFDDMTRMIVEKGHSMPKWNYFTGGNAIECVIARKKIFIANDCCLVGDKLTFATPRSAAAHLIKVQEAA